MLFLIVGLPGTGKTTRARELEQAHRAPRFSPDEWMIPLFGESDADGRRDLLEGLLINAGLRALCSLGADVEVVYLPIDEAAQRRRVQQRFHARPAHT